MGKRNVRSGHRPPTAEHARLVEAPADDDAWRLWGPYLAGRQWGTVREDYSADGDAWAGCAIATASSISVWPCGTNATTASRSDCSA